MNARADRLRGVGDIGALFFDEALLTPLPWEQAGRRKTHTIYDRDLVAALLVGPHWPRRSSTWTRSTCEAPSRS